MRQLLLPFAILLFLAGPANARPPLDPANTEAVLLESYAHEVMLREVFDQCRSVLPDLAPAFGKALAIWTERNRKSREFIDRALARHFRTRPEDLRKMKEAAPGIMKAQAAASPYNAAMCRNFLTSINTTKIWDYSVRLKEHMTIIADRVR